MRRTTLLIIGAGPYGLSLAAYAKRAQLDYALLGKPMGFWESNMPAGMWLRSGLDWHLDPHHEHTFNRYVELMNTPPDQCDPVSLQLFMAYARWFQQEKGIESTSALVRQLDRAGGGFEAQLSDESAIAARFVVVAPGFGYFKHVPPELERLLPEGRFSHTCDLVDFAPLAGKRCLIVGGRQSALEWAALLHEAGAAHVHVSHRHDTPALAPSDWSWVPQLVADTVKDPGWFRRLPAEQKQALAQRFWREGRLKLEPWLAPRLNHPTISFWPKTTVIGCNERSDGSLHIGLDNGQTLAVDHVILATGYKVNVAQIPYLAQGNLLKEVVTENGFPTLDEHFQSTVPGLFFTSFPATQDFGPFFGFVVGSPAAATVIGSFLQRRMAQR